MPFDGSILLPLCGRPCFFLLLFRREWSFSRRREDEDEDEDNRDDDDKDGNGNAVTVDDDVRS